MNKACESFWKEKCGLLCPCGWCVLRSLDGLFNESCSNVCSSDKLQKAQRVEGLVPLPFSLPPFSVSQGYSLVLHVK